MATPLHTPRVNNNDDAVRLTKVLVGPGAAVRAGDIVAEVETDKANFTVEAEVDGYVLAIAHELDQMIPVGSVLLWLGATPDEPVPPGDGEASDRPPAKRGEPTLKAAQLLARLGLKADDVPASGDRLSVKDIEAYVATRSGNGTGIAAVPPATKPRQPIATIAPGLGRPLTPDERAMLRTVRWHRDEAVPGYVEIEYSTASWEQIATDFQRRERLLISPLLPLMAWRLVRLASTHPEWNSTIVEDRRHVFEVVNLGFTVQSDRTLYLAVVNDAAALGCREFVERLGQLQRQALARRLQPSEMTGATISFSSMARWNVTRHVPVLPPFSSLIIAHAGARDGVGTLGATYDHRVLTGFDALSALRALCVPEGIE